MLVNLIYLFSVFYACGGREERRWVDVINLWREKLVAYSPNSCFTLTLSVGTSLPLIVLYLIIY